jgi:Ni,Fe-hydrogenase III component G
MTRSQDVLHAVQEALPGLSLEINQLPLNEIMVTIPSGNLLEITHLLVNAYGFYHLSTITGIDTGTSIEVMYHFWDKSGFTLRVVLQYGTLKLDSLTELIPGALLYERELSEMFGITIAGLDAAPLLLPDDWVEDPPMLKEKQ